MAPEPPEQVPPEQVCADVQACPQLPQLLVLLLVSVQTPPQSCWPATGQVQAPPLQAEPPVQAMPQLPQLRMSVIVLAHVPPEQAVVPLAQLDEQAPLLHTCVPVQVVPQVPQFALLDDTQLPPQFKRPVPQVQAPDWQVWPDLQTVPQLPQFCESVDRFVQPWVHAVWLALHVGPVLTGLAQLATKSEAPRMATRAACKEAWRASMFKLLKLGE